MDEQISEIRSLLQQYEDGLLFPEECFFKIEQIARDALTDMGCIPGE